MRISDWSSDVCSSDLTPSVEVTAKTAVAPNAPEIAMGDAISAMRADIVIGRDIMVTRAVAHDDERFASEIDFEIVTDFGNVVRQAGEGPAFRPHMRPLELGLFG